jgi:hypothetical protein
LSNEVTILDSRVLHSAIAPKKAFGFRVHLLAAFALAIVTGFHAYEGAVKVLQDEQIRAGRSGGLVLTIFIASIVIPLYLASITMAGLPVVIALTIVRQICGVRAAVGWWLYASLPIAVRSIAICMWAAFAGFDTVTAHLTPVAFLDPISIITSIGVYHVLTRNIGTTKRFATIVAVTTHLIGGALSLLAGG